MPNWCSNEVRIHGEEQEIKKFKEECFTEVVDTGSHLENSNEPALVFNFNKVMPEPDYKKPKKDGTHNDGVQTKLNASYEHPDWYNWRLDNWGTKWNILDKTPTLPTVSGVSSRTSYGGRVDIPADYDIDAGEDRIIMSFDTAWSPPNGIYEALVDKYPTLAINGFYREDGCQLAGWLPYD